MPYEFEPDETEILAELLPRTRTDFKLPPELYASNLEQFGVEADEALSRKAVEAYRSTHPQIVRYWWALDEAIQNAFDDGILWVTLGEKPGDLTA